MYKLLTLCGALALAFGLLLALPAHTCAQQWPQPTAETAAIVIEPPEKDVEDGKDDSVQPQAATVVATVNGLRLEEPPNQDSGGGLNSTLRAGTIDLRTPLAPGASIDVQFLLGAQTGGTYRFFVSVEPLD